MPAADEKAQLELEWRSLVIGMLTDIKASTAKELEGLRQLINETNQSIHNRMSSVESRLNCVEKDGAADRERLDGFIKTVERRLDDNKVEHRDYNQKILGLVKDGATVAAIVGLLIKLFVAK